MPIIANTYRTEHSFYVPDTVGIPDNRSRGRLHSYVHLTDGDIEAWGGEGLAQCHTELSAIEP